jgi:hypothetical protein
MGCPRSPSICAPAIGWKLPWLAGKMVGLGAARGVPTPISRVVYAALKLYMNGPPD